MTRVELKDAIAWEGKLLNNTEALAELDTIIQDAMIFIGQTHPELLLITKEDFDINDSEATPYTDALGVERVEICTDAALEEFHELPEESQVVGPSPLGPGKPKCYHIEGNASTSAASPKGIRVVLSPALDPGGEIFTIWWKKVPTLTTDSHIVPSAWIPFLKKEVIARVTTQRAKGELDVAKIQMASAAQAVQVEVSSNSASVAASN